MGTPSREVIPPLLHGALRRPLLALDLGSATGWALSAQDGRLCSGAWQYRHAPTSHVGTIFTAFRDWLRALVAEHAVVQIVYETPFHAAPGRRAAVILMGLEAVVQMTASERLLPVQGIAATTVKKRITGNGRAKKPEVAAALAARKLLPPGAGPDQADALALLFAILEDARPLR